MLPWQKQEMAAFGHRPIGLSHSTGSIATSLSVEPISPRKPLMNNLTAFSGFSTFSGFGGFVGTVGGVSANAFDRTYSPSGTAVERLNGNGPYPMQMQLMMFQQLQQPATQILPSNTPLQMQQIPAQPAMHGAKMPINPHGAMMTANPVPPPSRPVQQIMPLAPSLVQQPSFVPPTEAGESASLAQPPPPPSEKDVWAQVHDFIQKTFKGNILAFQYVSIQFLLRNLYKNKKANLYSALDAMLADAPVISPRIDTSARSKKERSTKKTDEPIVTNALLALSHPTKDTAFTIFSYLEGRDLAQMASLNRRWCELYREYLIRCSLHSFHKRMLSHRGNSYAAIAAQPGESNYHADAEEEGEHEYAIGSSRAVRNAMGRSTNPGRSGSVGDTQKRKKKKKIKPNLAFLNRNNASVACVQLYREHNDDMLFTGSMDGQIRLWDVANGTPRRTLSGHTANVRCLQVLRTPANQGCPMLVSAGWDEQIRLWEIPTGECIQSITGHGSMIWAMQADIGSDLVASAGSGNFAVKLWRLSRGNYLSALAGHTDKVRALQFDALQDVAVTGSYDTTIRVWSLTKACCLSMIKAHGKGVWALGFIDHWLVTASADATLKLWDTQTMKCVRAFAGHASGVNCMQFDPALGRLVSGSDDSTVRIWDIGSGRSIAVLPTGNWVNSLQFDSQRLVAASHDSIKVWESWMNL